MSTRSYVAVIDDDESSRRAMGRLLEQAGMHAISFFSAEEFLSDRLRDHFGCLLVDVQLPGMSGIEFRRELTALGVRTPVIYITAFDDAETRTEALKSGCVAFLRKTDAGVEIIAAIRRATSVRESSVESGTINGKR